MEQRGSQVEIEIETPSDYEDALKMIEFSEAMFHIAIESDAAGLSEMERAALGAIFTAVTSRIKARNGIRTSGNSSIESNTRDD